MKKWILFIVLSITSLRVLAQDSCGLRITLLTCAPGQELYSTFGHTAVRVQDFNAGTDNVYNYGTFEFGPDFYTQFIRGKLLYFLSVESFYEFMYQYRAEERSVWEQKIRLSCQAAHQLVGALDSNASEAHRFYKYDFLFDNCTTRARDILKQNAGDKVAFRNILPLVHPSFRDLIHGYLDRGGQPWSKLGIDILLGSGLDRKVSNEEAMFLPENLLKGFDSARLAGGPLADPATIIFSANTQSSSTSPFTPRLVFWLLFALIAIFTFLPSARISRILTIFDFLFFFLLGLTGVLLLFMWFGTDHALCSNNFNLLWALPTNAVAAFFVHSRKLKIYFGIVSGLSLVILAGWLFIPQHLDPDLIPIVSITALRSWRIFRLSYAGKTTHIRG